MKISHTALDCFLAVHATGSFTTAAKRVNRTQSAVSQQISKLEQLLETTLFVRGKRFTLTENGEILLKYAKKIKQLQREAWEQFQQPELQGEVRFGVPEDFVSVFLSDILAQYAIQHPRILLNVECDLTLNLFERFKNQEFDLVLLKMNQPEDFLNSTEVWSETLEWVGNPLLLTEDPQKPVPLVLSPEPCVYRTRAIKALEATQHPWRITFSSESYAGKIAAVQAGMGVTVLPRNMVPNKLPIIKPGPHVPKLEDTHICLLKHFDNNFVVNNLESFVLDKLR